MSVIQAWNPPTDWVREKIESAGTTIGSVHFKKRANGELRKMSYRLHVTKPSVAKAPKGIGAPIDSLIPKTTTVKANICSVCGKSDKECKKGPYKTVVRTVDLSTKTPAKPKVSKNVIDNANNQMTVLDANKVVRDENGTVIGRGAWRTVPLENVVRIACKGDEYVISRY